jgi:hypothetical protein
MRMEATRIHIHPVRVGDMDRFQVIDKRSWEREGTVWWEGTSHEKASIVAQEMAKDLMASGILDFVPFDTGPDCPF